MENKNVLFPALALGVGLGVGVATARTQTFHKWTSGGDSSPTVQLLELELLSQAVDGKDSTVTFDKFPYYLSEQTRVLLTNAACVHLKQLQFSKFTRNLSPASRTVLLTGPNGTETYHQMLAKALAHFFGAKLLILDVTDFSLKLQSKCGNMREADDSVFSSVTSANGLVQRFLGLISSDITPCEAAQNGSRPVLSFLSRSQSGSHLSSKAAPEPKGSTIKRTKSWAFEDKMLVVALYRVLLKLSEVKPTVLYLRDVENLVFSGAKTFSLFQRMINKLTGPVFIMGSRILQSSENEQVAPICEKLAALFPYNIHIKPPQDNAKLVSWRSQLEEDMKAIQAQDNRNHISEVLTANDVECDDLDSISFPDTLLISNFVEEIVVSAISHHLMNVDSPQYRNGRLIISSTSLVHGLSLFQAGQLDSKDAKLQCESNPELAQESPESSSKNEAKNEGVSEAKAVSDAVELVKADLGKKGDTDVVAKADVGKKGDADAVKKVDASAAAPAKEVPPDNEFEKRIRPEIIPAGEIGVSFKDIGALDDVKESLQELVMLPLRRPDLFNRGGLIKPCKGILLFGPPGTGKTMLAKAVATEAGASFINVSMSTITSKWFGEDEKNVRALFTLAAKVAPTIIFIDEVDSMLGQRSRTGEHEAMRKIKNEFMAHWDGLLSKAGERVLVLAATNRPFDLDDAIIRRFERRIMIGLPDKDNRERILRTILEKESIANDVDFSELANMTEGFSGSDLKNLCMVAAYRPIRELMKMEQKKKVEKKDEAVEVGSEKTSSSIATTEVVTGEMLKEETAEIPLRPLNMEDLKQAKTQISSSFAAEGAGMAELKEWNELYGEGGSRRKQPLTYFL
ncbi:hypothetical protein GOP47_0017856 [Adiantum capillus-veneris]|uniref:AAA+ ATPase domain-containing protein n=1 Tax=Adiantum capillus-veneris TaxID=13818 RepID=A0A9D4Z9L2_ADICA|nr:hypothetical protein GOP47_0017856 [Adiantum capillus-veneris]